MRRVVFVDSETTSLHPEHRRIWDLAIIVRDEGEEDKELQWFFDVDLEYADPFALDIGHYWERHPNPHHREHSLGVSSKYLIDDYYGVLTDLSLNLHKALVVGAVPWFDMETLSRDMRERGLVPTWHYHLQCVETLALGYLAAKSDPITEFPFSGDEISRRIGVDPPGPDQRHSALGDARWARDVWDRIMSG